MRLCLRALILCVGFASMGVYATVSSTLFLLFIMIKNKLSIKSFSEYPRLEDFVKKHETYNENRNNSQAKIQKKLGTVFIEGSNAYFATLYVLKMVNPNKIDYSEKWQKESEVIELESVKKYIEWYKQGFLPFPIQTSKNKKGEDVSANRRRLLAARVAKKRIPAFIEIGRYKDIVAESKRNGYIDKSLASGRITKNKLTRILKSVNMV